MLAAVLWLGNISFIVIDNENHVEAVEDEGNNLPLIMKIMSNTGIIWENLF